MGWVGGGGAYEEESYPFYEPYIFNSCIVCFFGRIGGCTSIALAKLQKSILFSKQMTQKKCEQNTFHMKST